MPSQEISYFPPHIAERMRKHLADAIYFESGNMRRDRDLEYADIYKTIDVKDELS